MFTSSLSDLFMHNSIMGIDSNAWQKALRSDAMSLLATETQAKACSILLTFPYGFHPGDRRGKRPSDGRAGCYELR